MRTNQKVAQIGCDCHRTFSTITARDENGRIVWRERLEHGDRVKLRKQLSSWPKGTPVILEGTFGWGWISDEMLAAGLDPHLLRADPGPHGVVRRRHARILRPIPAVCAGAAVCDLGGTGAAASGVDGGRGVPSDHSSPYRLHNAASGSVETHPATGFPVHERGWKPWTCFTQTDRF